ncbi:MAG: hypothetical protein LBP73_08410 [Clostridiales Family XIII bacterium]|nr:hypothetical protein [Clostridiales Family XIII bacterium]
MENFPDRFFASVLFNGIFGKISLFAVEFKAKYAIMVAEDAMMLSTPDSSDSRARRRGRRGIAFAGSGHTRTMYGKRCFACM